MNYPGCSRRTSEHPLRRRPEPLPATLPAARLQEVEEPSGAVQRPATQNSNDCSHPGCAGAVPDLGEPARATPGEQRGGGAEADRQPDPLRASTSNRSSRVESGEVRDQVGSDSSVHRPPRRASSQQPGMCGCGGCAVNSQRAMTPSQLASRSAWSVADQLIPEVRGPSWIDLAGATVPAAELRSLRPAPTSADVDIGGVKALSIVSCLASVKVGPWKPPSNAVISYAD